MERPCARRASVCTVAADFPSSEGAACRATMMLSGERLELKGRARRPRELSPFVLVASRISLLSQLFCPPGLPRRATPARAKPRRAMGQSHSSWVRKLSKRLLELPDEFGEGDA